MEPQDLTTLGEESSADGECPSPRAQTGSLTPEWVNRLYAIFEILLCSGILTSIAVQLIFYQLGYTDRSILSNSKTTAALVLLESVFLLGLVVLLQRARAQTLWNLGFQAQHYGKEVRIGLIIVPVLFVTNFLVTQMFRLWLPQWVSEENPLLNLVKTPGDLMLFLLVSLLAGGIKEEVQRAFILQRFRNYLSAATAGLIVWSIAFGAGHYVQGLDSAFGASLYGLIFGAVYLWRNCLIAPMVAHALYDMSVLTGYWFLSIK